MFVFLKNMKNEDLYLRADLITSFHIQEGGRGCVIITEEGEEIKVKTCRRDIVHQLIKLGYIFP